MVSYAYIDQLLTPQVGSLSRPLLAELVAMMSLSSRTTHFKNDKGLFACRGHIYVMPWPPCSPDMNPIEPLWDPLKEVCIKGWMIFAFWMISGGLPLRNGVLVPITKLWISFGVWLRDCTECYWANGGYYIHLTKLTKLKTVWQIKHITNKMHSRYYWAI